MGQKVNPISMRLQVNKDWRSKWFVGKREYAAYLKDDLEVRRLISKKLGSRAAINRVEIARTPNLVTVTIHTAKAGVVIGRGGTGIEAHAPGNSGCTARSPGRDTWRPGRNRFRCARPGPPLPGISAAIPTRFGCTDRA